MKIHNLEQQSPEWFAIRKWKMTASEAQAIWNNWKGLDTYIKKLMSETFSSWQKEFYSNSDTERGNELEEVARQMYELENDVIVDTVWFIEFNEFVWCSPDWLVWEDWWIEIKCLNDFNHFKLMLEGIDWIDTWYIWQIQMNLLITGRKWWDYVSYNPNFERTLIIYRILPDSIKHESLTKWLIIWKQKIQEIKKLLWK